MAYIGFTTQIYNEQLTNQEYEEGVKKLQGLGFDNEVFKDRITGEGLIILYNRGIDLKRYGMVDYSNTYRWIDYYPKRKFNLVDTFRYCCDNGLNLFMFRSYALKCRPDIIELLAITMKHKKVDYSTLLDYSKMPSEEAYNLAYALYLGIEKHIAFNHCRFIKSANLYYFKPLSKLLSIQDTIEVLNKYESDYDLPTIARVLKRYNLNIVDYIDIIYSLTYSDTHTWLAVIKHTKGKVVPETPDFYKEYLRLTTGDYYGQLYSNIIYEACCIAQVPMVEIPEYSVRHIAEPLAKCILSGKDYNFYLNLGLSDTELKSALSVLPPKTHPKYREHLGLKLI